MRAPKRTVNRQKTRAIAQTQTYTTNGTFTRGYGRGASVISGYGVPGNTTIPSDQNINPGFNNPQRYEYQLVVYTNYNDSTFPTYNVNTHGPFSGNPPSDHCDPPNFPGGNIAQRQTCRYYFNIPPYMNPSNPGNYNPTYPGNPGSPFSLFGVTFPGGPPDGAAAVVSELAINLPYSTTPYTVTLPSGASVTLKVKS